MTFQPQEDLKRKFDRSSDDDQQQQSNNKHFKASNEVKNSPSSGSSQVQDQQQQQQPVTPQRKKPGRKPNPASPALRKAQNRAAQRAFRERKEKHLRELEDTIKALRESQYESNIKSQKELQGLRSLIGSLKDEVCYWKEVALMSNISGGDTSKIKDNNLALTASATRMASQGVAFNFQPDNQIASSPFGMGNQQMINVLAAPTMLAAPMVATKSFLPSPTNSSVMLSPESSPSTPPSLSFGSLSPQNSFSLLGGNEQQLNDGNVDTDNETASTIDPTYLSNQSSTDYLEDTLYEQSLLHMQDYPQALPKNDPVTLQLIALSERVGQPDHYSPISPKVRHPLTEEQLYYLQVPHDPRIDRIPSLQLRARMIQYSGSYDLYELCDLLIKKAKCHGDPLDPSSWEMPEEFFERYKFLATRTCQINSTLYRSGKSPNGNFLKGASEMFTIS